MEKNKFAERLSEVLRAKGISQRAFSKQIGLEQQTLNGYCTGRHEPNLDVVVQIAKTLGESTDYLLGLVD